MTRPGMVVGFIALLFSLVGSVVIINLLWLAIQGLHPEYVYSSYRPRLSDEYLYVSGFFLVELAIATSSIAVVRKKASAVELAAGGLVFWFVVALTASILAPATSFLAIWVLLFGSLALLWAVVLQSKKAAWLLVGTGFLISAIVAIFLWLPTLVIVYFGGPMATGFLMLTIMVGLMALWLGAMMPVLDWITDGKRWLLPTAALTVGFGFLLAGNFLVGKESPAPMINSVGYWLDAESNKAYWVAFIGGTRIDAHTTTDVQAAFPDVLDDRQAKIMVDPIQRPYTELFPEAPPFSVLTSQAKPLAIEGPRLELVSDVWVGDHRDLIVQFFASMRDRLYIVIPEANLESFTLPNNDRTELVERDERWLRIDGMPNSGLEIIFEFSTSNPIQFLLVEEKTGLPSSPGSELQPPPGAMQSPGEFQQGVPSDFTAVYRPYEIPAIGQ